MGNPIPDNCTELRHYVETYRYDAVGNILQMVHHLGNNLESARDGGLEPPLSVSPGQQPPALHQHARRSAAA